jgi:TolB-like protein/Flp pilus assembly protein TadD
MRPSELDPERWRAIDRILEAAMDVAPEDLDAFLGEACQGDAELRAEVEALLAVESRSDARFDPPAGNVIEAALTGRGHADVQGRSLGPFRLIREIGRGGMGVVYLAEDTRLGRHVALKVLRPWLGAGPGANLRFRAEARAVSALDHPNIATLHQIDESEDGQLYMVFAFYEGETLGARIARGPLPVEDAVAIATRIAAGLAAAHQRGIIHRDIKPSNVLLTSGGEVKLLDFGVAKVVGEEFTGEGVQLGTIAYMSPEQAGGAQIDPRTDLWSLGVVLYEMLSGERPFQGHDRPSLVHSIIHDEPAPLSSEGSEQLVGLRRIIAKLLCKAPRGRYRTTENLLVDLRALAAGESPPIATHEPPPAGSGPAAWLRTVDRRLMHVGLVSLTVVAGGIWFASRASEAAGRVESLAVLPLVNLMADSTQQYVVDGVHSALIAELGKIGTLSVPSSAAVMRYRDTSLSVPEIAGQLGVDAVVEGSVLRTGDSLEITTQLTAASPERRLWARTYRRAMGNVYEFATDAARSIATEIDLTLTPEVETRLATAAPVNPEAYDAYVQGRFYWERRSPDAFRLARNYFRRSIQIDSSFALAYTGLADSYSYPAIWGLTKPADSYPRAKVLAETALRLDSTLAEAYASLATVRLFYDWDWTGAERLSRRALALNPSYAPAYIRLADALDNSGRPEEARAASERVFELEPFPIGSMARAANSYGRRDFDAAIDLARVAREFDPGLWQASWMLCLSLSGKGLHAQAIDECRQAVTLSGGNPQALSSLGAALALGGRPEEAERLIDELKELAAERYVPASFTAIVYGALGDRNQAFEWLDRAVEERDSYLLQLDQPFFDPLRSDSRFDLLLQEIGYEPPVRVP